MLVTYATDGELFLKISNGVLLIGGQTVPGRYCPRFNIRGEIILPERVHKKPKAKNNQYGKNQLLQKKKPPFVHRIAGAFHTLQLTAKKQTFMLPA